MQTIEKFILILIRIYQKTLSPNHSWLNNLSGFYRCRFYPTCSQYTHQAIKNYGVKNGFKLSFKRLFRCWQANGGYDPLK